MTPTPELQERIRRYLLGQLNDGARETLEQDLLSNEELFEELLVSEDEIIDAYLGGKLSADERANFERHFLATPERHEKLKFGRALNRYLTVAGRQGTSTGKFLPVFWSNRTILYRATAAIAVIAVIAGAFLFFRHRNSSPATFATLTLTISAGTRDQGVKATTVRLQTFNADALRVVLVLPNPKLPTVRYRVELEDLITGGRRSLEPVAQDDQSITVVIPAIALKRTQYSLKLFAVRAEVGEQRINGSYLFTVE